MQPVHLDPIRQEQAVRYARIRRRLYALELVLGAGYLIAWATLPWGSDILAVFRRKILNFSSGAGDAWLLELLVLCAAFGLPWWIATAPLRYYRGFQLPHRFGLSTQTLPAWLLDQLKATLLGGGLGLPMLTGLYALLRANPDTWWLLTGAAYTLLSVVFTILTPVVFLPIFLKSTPLSAEHAGLAGRLMRLAEKTGTRVEGVYAIDLSRRTRAANAALAGMGKTRRILLGDTLLEEFSEAEIEVVMAHEIAHQKHSDIPLGIAIQSVLNLAMFYFTGLALDRYVSALGTSPGDPVGFPMLLLSFSLFGFLTMPLHNVFSRWRERLADRFALTVTHQPQAFRDAMTRLANQNLAELDPEPWVVFLLHSHPPLRERIAMAERFQGASDPPR